jgi:Flp pilus assembly protein CpaB
MELSRNKTKIPSLRGLPATRRGAVGLALLCMLAAAAILIYAIGQYRKGVQTTAQQDTVLVATGVIQKGTPGTVIASQQQFRSTPVLATGVTAGALTNATLLLGKVAAKDILPGQQLTLADFTALGGVASQLGPAQRAIALSLDGAHSLSGLLQSGDRVDVYAGFAPVSGSAPGASSSTILRLLVASALVLKAPAASGGGGGIGGGSSAPTGNVVLQVSDGQAPIVAYAADNAKLWLVLRPPNAQSPTQMPTTQASILAGQLSANSPAAGAAGSKTKGGH